MRQVQWTNAGFMLAKSSVALFMVAFLACTTAMASPVSMLRQSEPPLAHASTVEERDSDGLASAIRYVQLKMEQDMLMRLLPVSSATQPVLGAEEVLPSMPGQFERLQIPLVMPSR